MSLHGTQETVTSKQESAVLPASRSDGRAVGGGGKNRNEVLTLLQFPASYPPPVVSLAFNFNPLVHLLFRGSLESPWELKAMPKAFLVTPVVFKCIR